MSDTPRPLTPADKVTAFKQATAGLERRCGDRFITGMTDEELHRALADTLGIFGGSSGPGRIGVMHQGAGLRIWAGWHVVNHCQEALLFSGQQTVAMAREVYGIPDPADQQISLL